MEILLRADLQECIGWNSEGVFLDGFFQVLVSPQVFQQLVAPSLPVTNRKSLYNVYTAAYYVLIPSMSIISYYGASL